MKLPKKLILNFFTKSYLKQADSFPLTILNTRMRSMICDLWFYMALIMPVFIVYMIVSLLIQSFIFPNMDYFPTYIFVMTIPWLGMLFVILNKDLPRGMSAGKRTFGFRIVDYKTKKEASQIQCMLRNITMFIWPLEVLLILINPKRRLGDFIAKTEVVKTEKLEIETFVVDLESIDKVSPNLIILSVSISIVMSALLLFGEI